MSKEEKLNYFKEKVVGHFNSENFHECLHELMDSDSLQKEIGLSIEENNDSIIYDSYGSEDSYLERVFRYEDFFIKISGNRSSYDGVCWNEVKVVEKKQKTIYKYE